MIIQKLPSLSSGTLTISNAVITLKDAIIAADSPSSDNFDFLDGMNFVHFTVDANDVRYTIDGNDPSATEGTLAYSGDTVQLDGVDLNKVKFFRDGGVDVTITITAIGKRKDGEF